MDYKMQIFDLISKEKNRQLNGLELIASENYVSQSILDVAGSVLTNKYAEGYPGRRYYGGCEFVDQVEQLAIDLVKKVFGVSYVNVQPHSGSQANAAVLSACLKPGDKMLGFDLVHGGHLTHGATVNFSGKLYQTSFYGVKRESERLDYDDIQRITLNEKPKLIIAGATAYSRNIDYKRFREIADNVGALLIADIAHPAGLIAKGLLSDPVPYCHIITTTTHKTLRGPRGGLIMMGKDFENPFGELDRKNQPKMMSTLLDTAVFPGNQGGPLMHIIGAKAIAFQEVLTDEFHTYVHQVQQNARAMADAFIQLGYKVVSGGTDNHLMLIDLTNKNITGKEAEQLLGRADITLNKNMVPFDTKSPLLTSGIRIGTAAITTRGLTTNDMPIIVEMIDEVLNNSNNTDFIRKKVNHMMSDRPIFHQF